MTRYTWIDGVYVEVDACGDCPFFSTEYELGAMCKYPVDPADEDLTERYGFLGDDEGVAPDCPLREKV